MRHYDGAVFFIDILGMGALTQGKVKLDKLDFGSWRLKSGENTNHFFASKILSVFRKNLMKVQGKYGVRVAQLSDCAFIWSEDEYELFSAASFCMHLMLLDGVLCRGGLAVGDIIEPDKVRRSIGEFIVGDAVTRAVKLESAGKGMRIFCDEKTGDLTTGGWSGIFPPVVMLKSPIDCSVVDEFCWYFFDENLKSTFNLKPNQSLKLRNKVIDYLAMLKFSPLFHWNSCSAQGRLHLANSIGVLGSFMTEHFPELELGFKCEDFENHSKESPKDSSRSNEMVNKARVIWMQ